MMDRTSCPEHVSPTRHEAVHAVCNGLLELFHEMRWGWRQSSNSIAAQQSRLVQGHRDAMRGEISLASMKFCERRACWSLSGRWRVCDAIMHTPAMHEEHATGHDERTRKRVFSTVWYEL